MKRWRHLKNQDGAPTALFRADDWIEARPPELTPHDVNHVPRLREYWRSPPCLLRRDGCLRPRTPGKAGHRPPDPRMAVALRSVSDAANARDERRTRAPSRRETPPHELRAHELSCLHCSVS